MAARGAESKEQITQQILTAFPGSFRYEKEIRIPTYENGELIQIKVTLTAAKTNVEPEDGGATASAVENPIPIPVTTSVPKNFMNAPTPEEKQRVEDLVKKLGLA